MNSPAEPNVRAGWSLRTAHLRIWDYTVTFGSRPHNLPLFDLPVIAQNFRFYLDHGVEGLFVEHDHPVLADLRDLKTWVLFKLAEEPGRDLEALIVDFTQGFYGPAGATIREYLASLERAARERPPSIRFPAEPEQYRHLTPEFLREAQGLFDRAAREVQGDTLLQRRLRFARLSLDRATLVLWDPSLAVEDPRPGAAPALDPRAVAKRIRATTGAEIERRLRPPQWDKARREIERELDRALGKALDSPARR